MCLEFSGVPTSRTIGVRHVDVAAFVKGVIRNGAQGVVVLAGCKPLSHRSWNSRYTSVMTTLRGKRGCQRRVSAVLYASLSRLRPIARTSTIIPSSSEAEGMLRYTMRFSDPSTRRDRSPLRVLVRGLPTSGLSRRRRIAVFSAARETSVSSPASMTSVRITTRATWTRGCSGHVLGAVQDILGIDPVPRDACPVKDCLI